MRSAARGCGYGPRQPIRREAPLGLYRVLVRRQREAGKRHGRVSGYLVQSESGFPFLREDLT